MKKYIAIISIVVIYFLATCALFGQSNDLVVQFKIPFVIQSSDPRIDTLWIGVHGDGPGGKIVDNTYGPDYKSIYGPAGEWSEYLYPPDFPNVEYVTKFVDLPGRTEIGGTGMRPWDFRGFTGVNQVDSFAIRIYGSKVAEGKIVISWPKNLEKYGKKWQLQKKQGTKFVVLVEDMTTMKSYTYANTESADRLDLLIIKTGVIPQGKKKTGK